MSIYITYHQWIEINFKSRYKGGNRARSQHFQRDEGAFQRWKVAGARLIFFFIKWIKKYRRSFIGTMFYISCVKAVFPRVLIALYLIMTAFELCFWICVTVCTSLTMFSPQSNIPQGIGWHSGTELLPRTNVVVNTRKIWCVSGRYFAHRFVYLWSWLI